MTDQVSDIAQTWHVRQDYATGEALAGFFKRLRDERKLYGRRCPICEKVTCPPRDFCNRCLAATNDWVAVGSEGEVRTVTVIGASFTGFPPPPYAIAFIQLDGADTAILSRLTGRDWSAQEDWSLLIGRRCRAEIQDAPQGNWLDFHFVLI